MTVFSSSVLGGVILGTTPLPGAIYTSSAVVEVSGYTVVTSTTPIYVIGNSTITLSGYNTNVSTTPVYVIGNANIALSGYNTNVSTTPVYVIGNAIVTFTIPQITTSVGSVVISGNSNILIGGDTVSTIEGSTLPVGDANVAIFGHTIYATVGSVSTNVNVPIFVTGIPAVSTSTGTPYIVGDANVFVIGGTVRTSTGRVVVRQATKQLDSGEGISGIAYEEQYRKRRASIGRNYTVYVRGSVSQTSIGKVNVKIGRKPIKLVRESIVLIDAPKVAPKVLVVPKTTIAKKPIELVSAPIQKQNIKKAPIRLKSNISVRPPINVVTKSKSTVKLHKQPIKLMENEVPQVIRLQRMPIQMVSPDVLTDGETKHSHK